MGPKVLNFLSSPNGFFGDLKSFKILDCRQRIAEITTIFLILFSIIPFSNAFASGDEIELRDGTKIEGSVIAQGNVTQIPAQASAIFDTTEIWISTSEGIKKIPTSKIKTIH